MYKVKIISMTGKKQKINEEVFALEAADREGFDRTMTQISDCLYNMNIHFEVDADGDMLMDDLLVAISEEETVDETLRGKNAFYRVIGAQEV